MTSSLIQSGCACSGNTAFTTPTHRSVPCHATDLCKGFLHLPLQCFPSRRVLDSVANIRLTVAAAYIVQAQRYLLRSFLTRDWTLGALRRQLSTDFIVHQLLPAVTRPSSLIKGS